MDLGSNVKRGMPNRHLPSRDLSRQNLIDLILEETSSRELNIDDGSILYNKQFDKHLNFLTLLDSLRNLERDIGPKLPTRNSRGWKQYFQWLESTVDDSVKSGNYRSVVEIVDHNDPVRGSGLRAKKKFKKDELVFSISKNAMIMADTSTMEPTLANFINSDPIAKSMPNVAMALHLLNEYCKKLSSQWAPYLACLPSSYSTPLYLTKDQLKSLKFSSHLHEVLKMVRSVARQYAYFFKQFANLNKKLALKNGLTYESYCWAVSTISTRQNAVTQISSNLDSLNNQQYKSPCPSLVPLLDMCNHKLGSYCADYDNSTATVKLYALDDLDVGDEIYLYYGPRSSGEFYVHNGFVPEPEQIAMDYLPFSLSLNIHDKLFEKRLQLCQTFALPQTSREYRLYPNKARIDKALVVFLLIYHASEEELDHLLSSRRPEHLVSNIVEIICLHNWDLKPTPQNEANSLNDSLPDEDQEFCKTCGLRLAEQVKLYMCQRAKILLKFLQPEMSVNGEAQSSTDVIKKLLESERHLLSSYV